MKSSELVKIYEDTQSIINSSDALRNKTKQSINRTKLYHEGFLATNHQPKSAADNVVVKQGSSFDVARSISSGKVAVLNFANPHVPGGGVVRGAKAQEECLCRCSNLYNVLSVENLEKEYYKWHEENTDYLFSDKVIYTPGIQIIKTDLYEHLESYVTVDVITCAAPYNVYGHDIEVLKRTFSTRITNIIEVAIENDVDVIVLGAFGCGAFHNPPELVADMFKEVLINRGYQKYFQKVVFAIINSNPFDRNFMVFQSAFSK